MTEPEIFQIRQTHAAGRLAEMAERIGIRVSVAARIRQRADSETVQYQEKYTSNHIGGHYNRITESTKFSPLLSRIFLAPLLNDRDTGARTDSICASFEHGQNRL